MDLAHPEVERHVFAACDGLAEVRALAIAGEWMQARRRSAQCVRSILCACKAHRREAAAVDVPFSTPRDPAAEAVEAAWLHPVAPLTAIEARQEWRETCSHLIGLLATAAEILPLRSLGRSRIEAGRVLLSALV